MAQYIDTVSSTLQNFNDSMRSLQDMKRNTIAQKLQLADLLNRQGKNLEAEKALKGAQSYGLSSLFADAPKEWQAQNPFSQKDMQIKSLQSLKDVPTNASQDQGAILADLKVTNPDMYNFMIKQEADKKAESLLESTSPDNNSSGNILPYDTHVNASDKQLTSQSSEFEKLRSLYKQSVQERERINAPIIQANNEATAYNKQAEVFNKNNVKSFGGNEVDQQQGLIKNTLSAVKNGGGMDAYMKYLATTKAIDDHYQHNNKALPPEYFGLGGKGKGGGTSDQYLYGDSEQVIDIPKSEMSTSAKREAYIQKMYPDIYAKGTILKKAGTNSGETLNPLQKEQLKASANENDMMFKAAAAQAWNEADPDGVNIFNKKERAELANRSLPSDNPYKFDENGNIVRGNGNVAVKPWK
jgi:hypothetical protein